MRALKKVLAFIVSISMIATFSACNSNEKESSKEETTTEITTEVPTEAATEEFTEAPTEDITIPTKEYVLDKEHIFDDIIFYVSSDWLCQEKDNNHSWFCDDGNLIIANWDQLSSNFEFDDNFKEQYLQGVSDAQDTELLEHENVSLPNISNALKFRVKNSEVLCTMYTFKVGNRLYTIGGSEGVKGANENLKYVEEVLASVKINEMETEPPTEKETEPPTEKEKTSIGMRNALSTAKDYLDYTAFSYKGLIEQLEYEGYTNEEATYGADNCGADWNEQAAKMAQDYLDYSSFSRQGLIDQLLYEGFTEEQAEYGVDAVGY